MTTRTTECLDSLGRPIPHMRDWVPAFRMTEQQRLDAIRQAREQPFPQPAEPEPEPDVYPAPYSEPPPEDYPDWLDDDSINYPPGEEEEPQEEPQEEQDNEPEDTEASWDIWRDIYETGHRRPKGYSAENVRNRILKALPDARIFPIDYRPGRKDNRGTLSELVRPDGWQTTTPGGFETDIPRFRKADMVGWVLDRWEVVDVDEPEEAEQAGITPQVLVEAGGMIVLTPSGGCHAIFKNNPNRKTKRAIRPVDGVDWLTGKSYIYAPHSWRPEHHQAGRIKKAGLYLPIWDKFEPVPCPDWLYRLVFPAKANPKGRNYDPKTAEDNRPQWAILQDAAVKLRQAFPGISAEAAADILWQQHTENGWLPNEKTEWPWTIEEMTNRIRNAWSNRDDYEQQNPVKSRRNRNKRRKRRKTIEE